VRGSLLTLLALERGLVGTVKALYVCGDANRATGTCCRPIPGFNARALPGLGELIHTYKRGVQSTYCCLRDTSCFVRWNYIPNNGIRRLFGWEVHAV
jgi:hypothetical protein